MPVPLAKMLSIMSRTYLQYISKTLKALELNINAFPVIMRLDHDAGLSINELAKNTRVNKALISKAVRDLLAQGYLMMRQDEDLHRQRFQLYLTKKGEKLVPIFKKLTIDYQNYILEPLKKTEKKQLLSLLEKIYLWHTK